MASQRPYYTLLFALCCFAGYAQNLVPNGNFEYYTPVCPPSVGMVALAVPWYGISSPDYFHACHTGPDVSVPSSSFGYQIPRSGSAYVGFVAYRSSGTTDRREYVAVRLADSLEACEQYVFTMYLSLSGEKSGRAIDEIGAYFSKDSIQKIGGQDLLPFTPQVSSPDGVFLSDTMNWMEVTDTFTAQGGEQFAVIGNFKNNAMTDTLCIDCITLWKSTDYYFLDDVSLYRLYDLNASIGSDKICAGQSTTLQACGDTVFAWTEQGRPLDTIATTKTVTVSPVRTTTYIVTGSGGRRDSVTVTVQPPPCCGIEENLLLTNVFTPNGDGVNDMFTITPQYFEDYRLRIYNRWGGPVFTSENPLNGWDGRVQGTVLPEGTYYWVLQYKPPCSDGYRREKGWVALIR